MADSVSAGLQACQSRVDSGMKTLLTDLDNTVIRKMQKEMYLCSARCCDQVGSGRQECVSRCQQPVQQAEEYVQRELTEFLDRLQRCTMQCQDDAKDKLRGKVSDAEGEKVKRNMESCMIKCGDKRVSVLPSIGKRMSDYLNSL